MFRKLFPRKDKSREKYAESADPAPAVSPRPHSQLATRSSESTPPNLRQNSEGGATSEIPSASNNHSPAPNVDWNKPVKLSSYIVDPTAAYENKPNWKSTVYASAGLAIDVLKESSDAFTPLKSAILRYYDQTMANRETIESLIPRVEGLAESLSTPAPEGEIKEIRRRQKLKEKLEKVLRDLEPLAERGKITGFLNNVKDGETLTGLADDIRDAMMDYQAALQQDIYYKSHQLVGETGLSLLKGMHHTADAGFLAGDRGGCLKGTRRDVLLQIEQWLTDERDKRVFWLNGLAGTGKSTIAQTFAEISFADGKLGASFFCSRDFEDRSNLRAIFPTLAFQLAHRYPQYREQLLLVLKANHDVERESLSSQLEKIIVGPFKETRIPTLIVIDALDECKDKEPASALLSVLSRYAHEIPEVKFFITGRPEPPIREGFRLKPLRPITDVLKLHDVNRSHVNEDIRLYLTTNLTNIHETRSDCEFPAGWPSSHDVNILCKKADGLFIYASTVVKFVTSKYHIPTERLEFIMLCSQGAPHEGGINLLYTQILELAFRDADSSEQELYSRFRNVVGAVLLVFHPLPRKALCNLLTNCETPSHISTTLRFLHSLLNIPDGGDEPVRVFHKSFPDFLTDRTRCKDDRFFVDPAAHHEELLFSCLDLMEKGLKKNICGLEDYAVLSEVEDLSTRRETYIGDSLGYACRFWTKHLASVPWSGPRAKRVQEAVEGFFTKRLLWWVEVLSIMGHLRAAVPAINDVRQWYTSAGIPTCRYADDSERLILECFDAIHDSPSHIYHSALPLSPSSSWIRECYKTEVAREVRVLVGLPDQWDTCSRTVHLEGSTDAFSYGGNMIAVGLESNVVLLDAITGSRTSVLCGHKDMISSLAFSLDGALLVSRSKDNIINVWDVQTGGVIRTFDNCTSAASGVSISLGGTTIALGTSNGAIRLWDVRTGSCHSIETRQGSAITMIRFSPVDSQRLLSLSRDRTVQQWDLDGHQVGSSHHEADAVWDLAYASDGTRFVSCGRGILTVRDSKSGVLVVTIEKPDHPGGLLNRCCFSTDGRLVVCAAYTTILFWDITIPGARPVGHLVGHTKYISFLAFSSSLISGSHDRTVKFWQTSSFLADSTTTDQTDALIPIRSVKLFAKDGIVVTSHSDGMVKTWDLMTGRIKSSFPTPARGIVGMHLTGDTLIIVWCKGGDCHLWDVYREQFLRRFSFSMTDLRDLTISGDGSKLFGLGVYGIQAVSMQTGEDVGRVDLETSGWERLVVDGFKVGIRNSTRNRGWDFEGPTVSDIGEFSAQPRLHVVGWSLQANPCWIKDTVTGGLVFRFPAERYMRAGTEIRLDGRYLLVWTYYPEEWPRSAVGLMVIDLDPIWPQ